jgi:hypothetical protein
MPDMIRTVMVEQKMMYEEQIAQLRAERDEARREICKRVSVTRWEPQFPLMSETQYAEERGWDCFSDKAEADANNTLFRTTDGE